MLEVASTITSRRKALRLTQADAAALAGVSERFVRELESVKRSVRLDKVTDLLTALGLELDVRLRGGGR